MPYNFKKVNVVQNNSFSFKKVRLCSKRNPRGIRCICGSPLKYGEQFCPICGQETRAYVLNNEMKPYAPHITMEGNRIVIEDMLENQSLRLDTWICNAGRNTWEG